MRIDYEDVFVLGKDRLPRKLLLPVKRNRPPSTTHDALECYRRRSLPENEKLFIMLQYTH